MDDDDADVRQKRYDDAVTAFQSAAKKSSQEVRPSARLGHAWPWVLTWK